MVATQNQTQGKSAVLPVPAHFDRSKADKVWPVDYGAVQRNAEGWGALHGIKEAVTDKVRVALLIIDAQITFCIPGFELYVGGRSGRGAVDDNIRLCEFMYRNMAGITQVFPTLDTHTQTQIFHPRFWENDKGEHPDPYTLITHDDIKKGVWKVNHKIVATVAGNPGAYMGLQRHVEHYTAELERSGKYALIVWPYHAMLGGIGHALTPIVHEAVEFHNAARSSQTGFEIKGGNPLTENYSVLAPEVTTTIGRDPGNPSKLAVVPLPSAQKNFAFIKKLIDPVSGFDVIGIAGQAASHCVAWTIDDLLRDIKTQNPDLARKVHIMEDCTSPVVTPAIDFTDDAAKAIARFQSEGMRVVKSTTPLVEWPGYVEAAAAKGI